MTNNEKKENKQDLFGLLTNEIASKVAIQLQNSKGLFQEPLQQQQEDIFLNTEEACNFLRITEPTLRKYVNAGRIKKYKRGERGNFYKKSDLIKFLENGSK
jgi:excisionase family DNA binding protein